MMGREIRMVPPNWKHPEGYRPNGHYGPQPMFNQTYAAKSSEFMERLVEAMKDWEASGQAEYYPNGIFHWIYEEAPGDPAYYRPYENSEATWFQLWETVSEGAPVSPPFETREDLAAYLAEHGDYWDQKRCKEPDWVKLWGGTPGVSAWGKERAERFVFGVGWAPTLIVRTAS